MYPRNSDLGQGRGLSRTSELPAKQVLSCHHRGPGKLPGCPLICPLKRSRVSSACSQSLSPHQVGKQSLRATRTGPGQKLLALTQQSKKTAWEPDLLPTHTLGLRVPFRNPHRSLGLLGCEHQTWSARVAELSAEPQAERHLQLTWCKHPAPLLPALLRGYNSDCLCHGPVDLLKPLDVRHPPRVTHQLQRRDRGPLGQSAGGWGQYRGTCYRRQRNGAALRGTASAHYELALCQVLRTSHKQNTPCPALLALAHTIQQARPKIHSNSSNNQGPQYGQKCQPRMAKTELLSS